MTEIPKELRNALTTLMRENVGDFVYDIRERVASDTSFEGNIWTHPRILAFSRAVKIITKYAGV